MRRVTIALGLGLACAGAAAADVALVIAPTETERRGLLGSVDLDTRPALRAAGFDVISAETGDADAMRAALAELLDRIADEPRVVIHLTGAYASGAGRSWLLAEGEAARNLATVDGSALSLDTVLAVAAMKPGAAVVVLGATTEDPPDLGAGLSPGPATEAVPQGVTVVAGPDAAMARFVRERLTAPGIPLAALAEGVAGARIAGFLGAAPFLPDGEARPIAPPDPAEAERAVWQAAEAQDSVGAYRGYLDRYPQGLFAEQARQAIAAIEAEPEREARLAEEALALDRDTRRRIQRELTLLEYQPRGIDGIFGPGTRAALRRFQEANGFPVTGYLDRLQIDRLGLQAARRQAEIEAEEERQRLEREREDRVTWEATGAAGDEAGLRTYLRRWPEGLYSDEAKARLAEIEAARRAEAEARAEVAWKDAEADGSRAALEAFLRRYPESGFADEAKAKLDAAIAAEEAAAAPEPTPPPAQEAGDAAARAAEEKLGLPQITVILVERRLEQLGLDPGRTDGVLDADSRAAIRRFQEANGLPETGYLSSEMLTAMLLDLGSVIAPGGN